MQLRDWLASKRMKPDEFAKAAGASKGAVLKWMYGERFPRRSQLDKIREVTKGKVTANDFF
tara:strand:- start:1699 stop:1881 length:183 start_codon:yes stop_codon:yes gene_type:complete